MLSPAFHLSRSILPGVIFPAAFAGCQTFCDLARIVFFYAGDRHEPVHVHVERDTGTAKFWLEPVSLQSSAGFPRAELNEIQRLIIQHHPILLQRWHDYFDS